MPLPTANTAYWQRADLLIRLALEEDLPGEDITTAAVLSAGRTASASIIAEEDLTVSGIDIARRVFEIFDTGVVWETHISDGGKAHKGSALARVDGRADSLLGAERTALNFLQHLSGIATATAAIVGKVRGLPVKIMDTRKTLPGWRILEKAAVRDGGGVNHRFSLSDGVLIKDNHLKLCGGVSAALESARTNLPTGSRIEVETGSLEEVKEAVRAGADVILVDNATPEELSDALAVVGGRIAVEASGRIGEENVLDMARTGVSMISIGSLTHSARVVDISMEVQ